MFFKAAESSLPKILEQANDYVNARITASATGLDHKQASYVDFIALKNAIEADRKVIHQNNNQDYSDQTVFQLRLETAKREKRGNCYERSLCALDFFMQHNLFAKVYSLQDPGNSKGDYLASHVVVAVSQVPFETLEKDREIYISDPHLRDFYPVSELESRIKVHVLKERSTLFFYHHPDIEHLKKLLTDYSQKYNLVYPAIIKQQTGLSYLYKSHDKWQTRLIPEDKVLAFNLNDFFHPGENLRPRPAKIQYLSTELIHFIERNLDECSLFENHLLPYHSTMVFKVLFDSTSLLQNNTLSSQP